MVSRVACGSRLITTITVSSSACLLNTRTFSSSPLCTGMLRSSWRAGCARRISFSRVMYGARVRPSAAAASQSRIRIWYFSESRYSSLPGLTATCSKSSYPAYTPQLGDDVAASAARILNAAGPPYWRKAWRMSGVFTKKFGRIRWSVSCDSSRRYSSISQRAVRHVKYV